MLNLEEWKWKRRNISDNLIWFYSLLKWPHSMAPHSTSKQWNQCLRLAGMFHYIISSKCFQNKSLLNQFDKCQQGRLLDANWMRIREETKFCSNQIKTKWWNKEMKKKKWKMYIKSKNEIWETVIFEKGEENLFALKILS